MTLRKINEFTAMEIRRTIQYLKDNPQNSKYDGSPLFIDLIKQFEDELKRREIEHD